MIICVILLAGNSITSYFKPRLNITSNPLDAEEEVKHESQAAVEVEQSTKPCLREAERDNSLSEEFEQDEMKKVNPSRTNGTLTKRKLQVSNFVELVNIYNFDVSFRSIIRV